MLVDKKEYIDKLVEPIKTIRRKRKIMSVIKDNLAQYSIYPGDIQETLNDPVGKLEIIDERKLFLIGEQVYLHTRNEDIAPEKFFTETEMKKARQFSGKLERGEEIELPLILENVIYLGRGRYLTYIKAKTIKKLMDAMLLEYNFDIQREPVKVIVNGEVQYRPKVNKQNIKEIKEHLINGTLEPTQIVLNAAIRTSETGNEIDHDREENKIIINKGTRLDIVDGFHRCTGTQLALEMDGDIDFSFPLLLTNYSDEKAKNFQAQFAKQMQIGKLRQKVLEKETHGDVVIEELELRSELKRRISHEYWIKSSRGELVSYDVLLDSINKSFKIDTKADAYDVADYLVEFFDYLIGKYKKEFITDYSEIKKISFINANIMFAGYVRLASRMMKEGLSPRELTKYIDQIDFNRENPVWAEMKIVDEKRQIKQNKKENVKKIMEFFDRIEL